jgi:LPXTG-motif cell wall-anchored protein
MPAPAVTPALEPGTGPKPVPTSRINWWIIAGIFIIIAIAGLASYYFIRKKRKMV